MSSANEQASEAVILDDKTAVFPMGTDIFGDGSPPTSATPSDPSVAAALATLDSAAELSWAGDHSRLISGYQFDGSTTIRIDLSCSAERLEQPGDALKAVRDAVSIDGGGACYGFATFDIDGNLDQWGTNGES